MESKTSMNFRSRCKSTPLMTRIVDLAHNSFGAGSLRQSINQHCENLFGTGQSYFNESLLQLKLRLYSQYPDIVEVIEIFDKIIDAVEKQNKEVQTRSNIYS